MKNTSLNTITPNVAEIKYHEAVFTATYAPYEHSKTIRKQMIARSIADQKLIAQEMWEREHICPHCHLVLPLSEVCDCGYMTNDAAIRQILRDAREHGYTPVPNK